jgi:hypothetical protein
VSHLVSPRSQFLTSSSDVKSEEDLQLKNELEMLVERLRVREFAAEFLNGLTSEFF